MLLVRDHLKTNQQVNMVYGDFTKCVITYSISSVHVENNQPWISVSADQAHRCLILVENKNIIINVNNAASLTLTHSQKMDPHFPKGQKKR